MPLKVLNLLASDMTESLSYLATEDGAGLKALILHSVSLGLATCRSDIHSLLKHTLLWVQAKKLQVNVIQLADQCIQVGYHWISEADVLFHSFLISMEPSIYIHKISSSLMFIFLSSLSQK